MNRHVQLNQAQVVKTGKCVVYVMSRDQRVHDNHALLRAQAIALQHNLPLVVIFCLFKTGVRAREHYDFMLAGLREVEAELKDHNISFLIVIGPPKTVLKNTFDHLQPASVVFDFNPLRGPKNLADHFAKTLACPLEVVDTHNVVPVWVASDKQEYAAATIRRKINSRLPEFLIEPDELTNHPHSLDADFKPIEDLQDLIHDYLKDIPQSGIKIDYKPGPAAAFKHASQFIGTKLQHYHELRNDPANNYLSDISPYLHYGSISSLRLSLMVNQALAAGQELSAGAASFLEELIIRKELSDNFCHYNPNYASFKGAPAWAQQTLEFHRQDVREFNYSLEQLQACTTHDDAWNAAQAQLAATGKIHGYMRMYWAKKVLEWTEGPEIAISYLTYLNDFYSIDGGDPNGYTGIMWSIAGVHDRGWTERQIFGKIRYMNYNGLKRKFKIDKYQETWLGNRLV